MILWFWFGVTIAIQLAYVFTTGDMVGALMVWFWFAYCYGLIRLESDFDAITEKITHA